MKYSLRGYTIVELSISVSVAAILVGMLVLHINNILVSIRIEETTGATIEAVRVVDHFYVGRANYVGLNVKAAADLGALDGFKVERNEDNAINKVSHAFGYLVGVFQVGDSASGLWGVHLAGLPFSRCGEIVFGFARIGKAIIYVDESSGKGNGETDPYADLKTSNGVPSWAETAKRSSSGALLPGKKGTVVRDLGGALNPDVVARVCQGIASNRPPDTFGIGVVSGK